MVRHEILITPTPNAPQAPSGFEIRIRGHGSWQQSVIEALRVAAQAPNLNMMGPPPFGVAVSVGGRAHLRFRFT